jgi:hypothetical protein
MVGTTRPRSDGSGSCSVRIAHGQDAEAHDGDERLHQLLEAVVAAEPDEREAEEAVRDGAPRLRDRAAGQVGDPEPGRIGQRRADRDVQTTR